MDTLRDKTIVITGAGGAIAGSVARAFARAGAAPLLVDRDLVRIQGAGASLAAPLLEADLGTLAGARAMIQDAKRLRGRIDGVVHLIGDIVTGSVLEQEDDAYDRTFDTNVRSLVHTVQAALPDLVANGDGFIAGIASREAWGGVAPGAALFAAAKAAVATYLRSLDAELADTGVGVAIVYPMGPVDTPTNRRSFGADAPLIDPRMLAESLVAAAESGRGGRLLEIPVYPPRRIPQPA